MIKTYLLLPAFLLTACAFSRAADPRDQVKTNDIAADKSLVSSKDSVVERSANHKNWQRVAVYSTPNGKTVSVTNTYTELGTGMHYKEGEEWIDANETIRIQRDGSAAALTTAHKVNFQANINSTPAVILTTSDEKLLKSRIMGIGFYDFHLKKSVLVGELRDSVGTLVGKNQVLYADAFDGVNADVLYSNTKDGLEQDIVFREQPPSPEAYGLDPRTTWVEVWTEFFDAPDPSLQRETRKGWQKSTTDEFIDFGDMKIVRGTAFGMNGPADQTQSIPVAKHWMVQEGRTFLVEEVSYRRCKAPLRRLPLRRQAGLQKKAGSMVGLVSNERKLPMRVSAAQRPAEQMRMARLSNVKDEGFVIDYSVLQTATNFTFQSDTTYYLSSSVNLRGTTTIEGGTVVKYANNVSLNILSNIVCLAEDYRPAVFTAYNDPTVGESVSSAAISNATRAASIAINLSRPQTNLHNLHIRYATRGIVGWHDFNVTDSQFLHCSKAIETDYCSAWVKNVLMSDVGIGFTGYFYANSVEHLTYDSGQLAEDLAYDPVDCVGFGECSLMMTNSLLTAVDYSSHFVQLIGGADVVMLASATGIYQKVGGAGYYLANESPYRNAGTAVISSDLASALQKKTTFPPLVYSNSTISVETAFSPVPQRDTDIPDLGYHYAPIDVAFGGSTANANISFSPGTVVGWFRTSSGWYHAGHGLHLGDTKIATFRGTASAPTYWVRCNTVQEESTGKWQGGYGPGGMTGWADQYAEDPGQASEVQARFLRCSMLAGEGACHFRDDWGYINVRATHSEFWSGILGGYVISCFLTNCLMDRVGVGQSEGWPGNEFRIQNCTFRGGSFAINRSNVEIPVRVTDTSFDGTVIDTADQYATLNDGYTFYDWNAYLTNANQLYPTNGNDQTVNSFDWQTSWLGRFYLPPGSPLIDTGGQAAAGGGLYHFTTQADQTKETTSTVDIGYHYVATDSYGVPLDSDGDRSPDYLEDRNGNGTVDSGETDWLSGTDSGLTIRITQPKASSNIP
ncbi:MAG: hypothetical protein JWM68_1561 [Verrucomicrobiales bacterium]|nr:hypothetical protein [Verrucomicrobiales bacterium]